jgi:hypothetical protein
MLRPISASFEVLRRVTSRCPLFFSRLLSTNAYFFFSLAFRNSPLLSELSEKVNELFRQF